MLAGIFTNIDLTKNFSMQFKVANMFAEKVYSPPFGGAEYDLEWPRREYSVDIFYKF